MKFYGYFLLLLFPLFSGIHKQTDDPVRIKLSLEKKVQNENDKILIKIRFQNKSERTIRVSPSPVLAYKNYLERDFYLEIKEEGKPDLLKEENLADIDVLPIDYEQYVVLEKNAEVVYEYDLSITHSLKASKYKIRVVYDAANDKLNALTFQPKMLLYSNWVGIKIRSAVKK